VDVGTAIAILGYIAWPVLILVVAMLLLIAFLVLTGHRLERSRASQRPDTIASDRPRRR